MDLKELREAARPMKNTLPKRILRAISWATVRPYLRPLVDQINTLQDLPQQRAGALHYGSAMRAGIADTTALAHRLASIEEHLAALDAKHEHIRTQSIPGSELGGFNDRLRSLESLVSSLRTDARAVSGRLASIEDDLISRGQAAPDDAAGTKEATQPLRSGNAVGLTLIQSSVGRLLVPEGDMIGATLATGGFWDDHIKPVLDARGARGRHAIDVGAYIGCHTLYMAKRFGKVTALEPQEEIHRLLSANLVLNGITNVEALNLAAGSHVGHMFVAPDTWQEIPVPHHDGGIDYARIGNAAALTFQPCLQDNKDAVRAVTIDSLEPVDVSLIKVDAQGTDLRVLEGAVATITRDLPVLLFEHERNLAARHGISEDDVMRFLDRIGYRAAVLRDHDHGKQVDYVAWPGLYADWTEVP